MTPGQVQVSAAIIIYTIFGGAFPVGQLLAVELGRYEIWSHKRRLLVGSVLYVFSFAPAFVMILSLGWDLGLLPWVLISAIILEKIALRQLNRFLPERFQPTEKELREKYGEAFRIDQAEITAIIEDEFTKKLEFDRMTAAKQKRISFLKEEDQEDDQGLKDAVEGYIEKELGRKREAG